MIDLIRRRPLMSAIVAMILLVVLLSSFPIVPETKQGVVVRFGKPVRILNRYNANTPIGSPGAGITWRLPFAEQVVWIDKRVSMSTCSASRCFRPTSAGSRSTPSPATGSSIRC